MQESSLSIAQGNKEYGKNEVDWLRKMEKKLSL